MAEKKVINAGAIAAAQAQNVAAAQRQSALQAEAAKQQAIVKPIAQKAIPGISALTSGINAKIAELSGTVKTGSYNPITGRDTPVQSSSQLIQQSRNILGAITPTEIATGNTAANLYQKALKEAEGITFTPVPNAIYQEETTTNLSEEAFINTLKLLMGSAEASKPYVKQLYTLVSKYYKSGSTIPESINLALYDAEENKLIPEFTTRFSGIFKIRDRRAAGEAIDVPTIAEYIKSQERLGDILRQSALSDLANETFLNTVMATGKSVEESTSIIVDVFDLIDNAPAVVKAQFAKNFPSVTRAQLATALLTGPEGVKQLEKTVKKSGVIAAGTTQGIEVSDTLASDLVSKGQNFQTAGVGFSKVAQILPQARKLTSIEAGLAAGQQTYTTEQAVAATFDQSAKELQILADMAEREGARFSKRTGIAGSRSLASQARGYGSGLI